MTPSWLELSSLDKSSTLSLVLLHGWSQTANSVRPLGELLRTVGTVYLVDLPGFGGTPRPPSTWGTEDYADYLVRSLQEKGISKAVYLGHSFGGKVALSAAIRHPDHVQALALMAPSGVRPKRPLKERMRFKTIAYSGKSLKWFDRFFKTSFYQNLFIPRYGSRDYLNAGEMRDILVRSVQDDLTPHLTNLLQPTLLLWGEKDRDAHFASGLKMASLIPSAKLVAFPQKGHHIQQGVGAHLCASYILPFLSSFKGASQ